MYRYYCYYINKNYKKREIIDIVDSYGVCKTIFDIHSEILSEWMKNDKIIDYRAVIEKV